MLSEAKDSICRTAAKAKETVLSSLTQINEDTVNDENNGPDMEPGRNGMVTDRRNQFERSESFIMRGANDFHNEKELENNLRWKTYAARIDDVSRTIFPLAYSIALAVILTQAF